MIISASYRTDIPAFYGAWFINRFRAGYALVENPYGGKPARVSLREGCDGFVFWTRNAAPFMGGLREVRAAGLPFVVQYTVTGYPKALETSVIDTDRAVEQVRALAAEFGPRAVVWRYDPILFTSLTPPEWHADTFARLAAALAGAVDECATSFAAIYRKTARNTDAAARAHDFSWHDPGRDEKRATIAALADIARRHGIRLTVCSQAALVAGCAAPAACVDAKRLSDVAGHDVAARIKGNRPDCLCAESRDIGAYDTCPHGCVYCYAVSGRMAAKRRHRAHDAAAEFLIPPRD